MNYYKYLLGLFTCFLMFANGISAQAGLTEELSEIAWPGEVEGWVKFKQELKLDPGQIFQSHARAFGLQQEGSMKVEKVISDDLGYTHHRFQQYYRGVPIEGAEFTIHSRKGIAEKGNGKLADGIRVNTTPAVSKELALERALECVGAEKYSWESSAAEAALKNATGDPDATFYPVPELMISDDDFDPGDRANYQLVWKIEINSEKPVGRKWVYIDAFSGHVFKELDMLIHTNWEGSAETRYHGTRQIITDSTDQGYRLRENGRGLCEGIETYDANDSTSIDYATDFWDDDNHWDNANENFDEAAGDTHWGAEMTYDYYFKKHNRNSYDDEGSKMISYIHVGINWRNATWNGRWARFGDGTNNPWTSIDVVSHEFTHGVTRNSANLIYSNQSGALNESFSDIFGKAVEQYAIPETFSWRLNELIGEPIRNMSDPKEFGDPDTYFGENWVTGSGDNGGVHSNSGVQNYWFYLLVEGGSGVNDNGDPYEVEPIGWDTAAAIAYRNLTVYLQRFSQYIDARLGSLEATADLYGRCSDVYMQVANAWKAVGVGGEISPNDFGVISIDPIPHCGLGEEEVSVTVRYFGCDTLDSATIPVRLVKSNPLKVFNEVITVEETIVPDQVLSFTFPTPMDFSKGGEHHVTVETQMPDDPTGGNDAAEFITYNLKPMARGKFDFEDYPGPSRLSDTLIFFEGENNLIQVKAKIGVDSSYAIYIEGGNFELARTPDPGDDVFDINRDFGSRACFCMNTADMLNLQMSFDLRQTFSTHYDSLFGAATPQASALRVVADGQELARFYPETYTDDPFVNHTIDLTGYVDMQFDLCFEARAIMASWADPDTFGVSFGDRIYIDNINLTGDTVSTSVRELTFANTLDIYPNPSSGTARLAVDLVEAKEFQLAILTLNGAVVGQARYNLPAGKQAVNLPVEDLPPGMYLIRLLAGNELAVRKLVLQK